MYTTDRQTDVRQKHHLKPPPYLPNSPAQRMFTPARPASTNYRTNNSITPTTDYLPPFNYTTRSINQCQCTLPVNDDPSHQWKNQLLSAASRMEHKKKSRRETKKRKDWGMGKMWRSGYLLKTPMASNTCMSTSRVVGKCNMWHDDIIYIITCNHSQVSAALPHHHRGRHSSSLTNYSAANYKHSQARALSNHTLWAAVFAHKWVNDWLSSLLMALQHI